MAITKISGDLWKRSLEKVARDVQDSFKDHPVHHLLFCFVGCLVRYRYENYLTSIVALVPIC